MNFQVKGNTIVSKQINITHFTGITKDDKVIFNPEETKRLSNDEVMDNL